LPGARAVVTGELAVDDVERAALAEDRRAAFIGVLRVEDVGGIAAGEREVLDGELRALLIPGAREVQDARLAAAAQPPLAPALDDGVLLDILLRGHGDREGRGAAVERDDTALGERRVERGLGAVGGRAAADHGVRRRGVHGLDRVRTGRRRRV